MLTPNTSPNKKGNQKFKFDHNLNIISAGIKINLAPTQIIGPQIGKMFGNINKKQRSMCFIK
jgi:hypothetical protein